MEKDGFKAKEKLQKKSIAFPSNFLTLNLETIQNSNLCVCSWVFVVLLCFKGFLILTDLLKNKPLTRAGITCFLKEKYKEKQMSFFHV